MQRTVKKPKIIFEDDSILVIDKPFGMVVNRSGTTFGITLQDYLENDLGLHTKGDSEFVSRSGIVHRLDKETSGIIVVAKDQTSFYNLTKQFKDRRVYKEYSAIVNGRVEERTIEINAPLARSLTNRLKFAIVSEGKASFTRVEVEKEINFESNIFTKVKVIPKTGRTHQIRVHLSAIEHPIASDSIYCTKKLLEMNRKYFFRLMLHAGFLSIFHPVTDKKIDFTSDLPQEFQI